MEARTALAAAAAGALALVVAPAARAPATGCADPGATADYTRAVGSALASGRDVWGEQLLAAPGGPTLVAVQRRLPPLLYARGPHGRKLTASGVYYLPFADPPGPAGTGTAQLHVADGSEVIARRASGPSLTILVGDQGRERYGSCLGRLDPAQLEGGWLPVLETGYEDARGALYRQESFAARFQGRLTSLVSLSVDARSADGDVELRFSPTSGRALVVTVPRGTTRDVTVAWPPLRQVDAATYGIALKTLVREWRQRLAAGAQVSVPEPEVEDALRALLVQDSILGWRYSIGNPYEELSFPEAPDLATVMGELGFGGVERAILAEALTRSSSGYTSWKNGERLLDSAAYYRLFRDRAYLDAATPALAGFLTSLEREFGRDGHSLLARERYSADIPDTVFGTHAQSVAWAGQRAIAGVWAETGRAALARRALALAARLEPGLRAAIRTSEVRLPDGSLFVPARLLDDETPYASLVETRLGSYWNLVMPFAFSSGLVAPGGEDAQGILRYIQLHGSRLLGLVRAGAYALYGRTAPFPVSGTDEVYGVDVARFLADNDRSDQLVLSLYGELGAAMTPGTFVAGEGASVAPLDGLAYRAMYLPPNSESNAAFLETLRVMLVHETVDASGRPFGLDLAFATPRAWLAAGKRIAVDRMPTSFGPVSFSIAVASGGASAHVHVNVPTRPPKRLEIRLRLATGETRTIDLTKKRGAVDIDVRLASR